MDEPLHPSALSEILDRTAQLYRSRFLVFLGIAFVPTVALLVPFVGLVAFSLWTRTRIGANPMSGIIAGLALGLVGLVTVPVYVAAASLATAAMNHAASRAVFAQETTIRDAYKAVWRRGGRYVGLYLMELVGVWGIPFAAWTLLVMVSAMLAAVAGAAGMGGGGIFVFLAVLVVVGLVTYGIWMSIRLSLAFPATIVEQVGAWAGMRRSWGLSRGTQGRILVLYLMCTALHWILSLAVIFPLVLVVSLWPGVNSPQNVQAVGRVTVYIVYGSGFLIQAFTRPVYGIALALFYYDQRIRQEAFDIEWMMLQAGLLPPSAQASHAASLVEPPPWTQPVEETPNEAQAVAGQKIATTVAEEGSGPSERAVADSVAPAVGPVDEPVMQTSAHPENSETGETA